MLICKSTVFIISRVRPRKDKHFDISKKTLAVVNELKMKFAGFGGAIEHGPTSTKKPCSIMLVLTNACDKNSVVFCFLFNTQLTLLILDSCNLKALFLAVYACS